MKTETRTLDMKQSCDIYSRSIKNTLSRLLNIDVASSNQIESTTSFESDEDIYFSIFFTGQIYGEFVIGVNRKTAAEMLGLAKTDNLDEDQRAELIDAFKEIINIAAGTTLTDMRNTFADLSITPPRSIEGRITLSNLNLYKMKLDHPSGHISCYVYVDYMKLEVASIIQESEQEKEELNRLNRAKSEFLSNMSHELRTPLNGMIGMLDLLRTSNLTAAQSEQLNVIYKSGDFLLSIINDILEFSKIESGKLQIENHEFCLRECLESVAETMASGVFAKQLEFNVFVAPELRGVYLGDDTRIKQVLINLIGNAIKFTPTGSIRFEARYGAEQQIVMSVRDTGIGIPQSKLNHIFDSFSQVDVSDNRRYGGSGLGLTISKSIVNAMGGQIRVESEEAKGSTFIVEIPLIRVREASEVAPRQHRIAVCTGSGTLAADLKSYLPDSTVNAVDPGADLNGYDAVLLDFNGAPHLRPGARSRLNAAIRRSNIFVLFLARPQDVRLIADCKELDGWLNFNYLSLPLNQRRLHEMLDKKPQLGEIHRSEARELAPMKSKEGLCALLVEDNEINQTVAKAMIAKMGYSVEVAENGEVAVKMLKNREYGLVLMDCQMPVMNGYEATAEIRRLEKESGGHVPIIAMTANAFRETKQKCFECGMDDFVTKPIKLEALKDVIERHLKKGGAH